MKTKTIINVHAIDRDNGDGHYTYREHSFLPFDGPVDLSRDRIPAQDRIKNRGVVATIEVPEESRIEHDRLVLPDGTRHTAEGALLSSRIKREGIGAPHLVG